MKKIVIKIISFAIVSIILFCTLEAIEPTFNNDLALGQMENSDAAFILMESYNKIRNVSYTIYSIVALGVTGIVGYDIYAYIKEKDYE